MKPHGTIYDIKVTENGQDAEMLYLAESSVNNKSVILSQFNCNLLNSVISNSRQVEEYDLDGSTSEEPQNYFYQNTLNKNQPVTLATIRKFENENPSPTKKPQVETNPYLQNKSRQSVVKQQDVYTNDRSSSSTKFTSNKAPSSRGMQNESS